MEDSDARKVRKILRSRLSDIDKVKEIKKIMLHDLSGACGWICNHCGHKYVEKAIEEGVEDWGVQDQRDFFCPGCGSHNVEIE